MHPLLFEGDSSSTPSCRQLFSATNKEMTYFPWISKGYQHTSLEAQNHTLDSLGLQETHPAADFISTSGLYIHHFLIPRLQVSEPDSQGYGVSARKAELSQLEPISRAPTAMLKDATGKKKENKAGGGPQ